MTSPKITFVIPTHNRCAQVLKTLSLLRASVGRLPHEILVVANDCTDDTAQKVPGRFPSVRLIELSSNHHPAARNIALAAASAQFVFMLDDATWPDKATTEYALRQMTDQPNLAAAACTIHRLGEPLRPQIDAPAGIFSSSAVVLRQQALFEVGGYPIDYADALADCDLSARLWHAGWQVKPFASMLAWHEPTAPVPHADLLRNPLSASILRFWSHYAPDSRYEELVGEPLDRCHTRRRPLTSEQLASLLGTDQPQVQLARTPAA